MPKPRTERNKNSPNGMILYAKRSGRTSFASLWSIKHALGTGKVGHTGTLDSFAEGLLVVLCGKLTHLVPHITGFSKTYQAVVCFGRETDTLDPTGTLVCTGPAVSREALLEVLAQFRGALLQVPPAYSAVHVNGMRASDRARSGEAPALESRAVFVYRNELIDFHPAAETDPCSYALLEITCSKGTYIRALARDIAQKLGSCGHLCALRRTAVGPFRLEDAVGAGELEPFTVQNALFRAESQRMPASCGAGRPAVSCVEGAEFGSSIEENEIRRSLRIFTPELSVQCGFFAEQIKPRYQAHFLNGRPLHQEQFVPIAKPEVAPSGEVQHIAVFYDDRSFAGVIQKRDGHLSYGFVVPPVPSSERFRVFSWEQVVRGDFPRGWKEQGTALTVGSFDGMHVGHSALVSAVRSLDGTLVPGLVTFRHSVHSGKPGYAGAVSTVDQRLMMCQELGLSFAVVIDFSPEFSRIGGSDFVNMLQSLLGMKLLVEGSDFTCGHNGELSRHGLFSLSRERNFSLHVVDDVMVGGERASSSRIRAAVRGADFALARRLLGRPFSYDACGLVWRREYVSESGIWFSAQTVSPQVLPPCGVYSVALAVSERSGCAFGASERFFTVCEVAGLMLRVRLPSEAVLRQLCAIDFISVHKP